MKRKLNLVLSGLLLLSAVPAMSGNTYADSGDGRVESGWFIEDFENGTPAGWDVGMFYMANGGVDNSRAMHGETFMGSDDERTLTTHYVSMGENPSVAFDYKVVDLRFGSDNEAAADPDNVSFHLDVSDENGENWTTVYRIQPADGDATHIMSNKFARITVPLPQYAGKTCRIRIALDYFLGAEFQYCRYIFDNVEAGSRAACNLSVSGLNGPAFIDKGKVAEYAVTVSNKGTSLVNGQRIDLVGPDGNPVADTTVDALAPESSATAVFRWTPTAEGQFGLKAVAVVDGDADPSDNETPVLNVRVYNDGPAVMTVGEANGKPSPSAPVNFYGRNSYVQTIYNANEIGTSGVILTGLAYDTQFGLPLQTSDMTVWIGETDKETFENVNDWIDPASLSKVFEGKTYVSMERQKMELAFQTPYEYQGRNIVVCILRNDKDFYSGLNFIQDSDARFARATLASGNDLTEPTESADGEMVYPVGPEHPGEGLMLDLIPVTGFVGEMKPAGLVKGFVRDAAGNPLVKATVSVTGTMLTVAPDAEGYFEIPLAAGEYTLATKCPGFFDRTDDVTLSEGDVAEIDIELTALNSYVAAGSVKDMAGNPVPGLTVRALGYRNYRTVTAEDGSFRFPKILSADGKDYTLTAGGAGYKESALKVDLTEGESISFTVSEQLMRPYRVEASIDADKVSVKWEDPLMEYSYDAPGAQVNDVAGYEGWMNSVIGTAFPYNTQLHEVSWFTTDVNGTTHATVNIVITELDEIGWPTRNVIKVVEDVPNVDNKWSSLRFDEPLECPRGFFVGVNYPYDNTNVDICFTEPDDSHPVLEGRYFGCDDINFESDSRSRFADLSPYYKGNMLVRAAGVDCGAVDYTDYDRNRAPRSGEAQAVSVTYDVYRFVEGESQEVWTSVATGLNLNEFDDTSVAQMPKGKYGYAVAARYPSGVSEFRTSNLVDTNLMDIELPDAEPASEITGVYRLDGTAADARLQPGVYIVKYSDGTARKIIVK